MVADALARLVRLGLQQPEPGGRHGRLDSVRDRRVLLAAQVGIAGRTVVEDDVMMGGQVGVTGHVHIGKGAMFSAQKQG